MIPSGGKKRTERERAKERKKKKERKNEKKKTEEVEKVLAKRGRLSREGVRVFKDTSVVVKDIPQKLFGIKTKVDLSHLYMSWNLLKVMNPFPACIS